MLEWRLEQATEVKRCAEVFLYYRLLRILDCKLLQLPEGSAESRLPFVYLRMAGLNNIQVSITPKGQGNSGNDNI